MPQDGGRDGQRQPVVSASIGDNAFWTRQRRELIRWMEDRAPSFVQGYIGAVLLLHMPSFPARVHFICHVVRDIYWKLPTIVGAKSKQRPPEVFPNMVKELAERWRKFPAPGPIVAGKPNSEFTVSAQVYRYIEEIVRKSVEIQDQPSVGKQLAIALFRSLDRRDEELIQPWIIGSFDAEYDFFVKRAHLSHSVDKIPNEDGLIEHFEGFERAFHSLVGPYFTGKEELDAILQDTNQAAD